MNYPWCIPLRERLPTHPPLLIRRAKRQAALRQRRRAGRNHPREAMHIHVRGAQGEAKFWLTPTVYLADSDGFDARTLRELRDAVVDNKDLIERTWNEHFA
ncbi:MAG: DUF4160 domain-containing protein [Burkholderiales bacterium]|nr:DUF4160 domain-containing protein [Burkholderiales bacterium]